MKGSEAIIRAIAAEGGEIPAIRLEEWLGILYEKGYLEKEQKEDQYVFYWKLSGKAKRFLEQKKNKK